MTANDETARKRLAVLKLAEQLGNASEACRRSGVDRTSFHQWRKRFERDGLDGLHDRKPLRTSHPQATPADVARQIIALATKHPSLGCNRIERELAKRGIEVSAVTIQKILHKGGLGTEDKRGAVLEVSYAKRARLTSEQIGFLEKFNPNFRERDRRADRPGATIYLGTFYLGRFGETGTVYVHATIDSYSAYAFALLSSSSQAQNLLAVTRDLALPFFAARGLDVGTAITGGLSDASAQVLRDVLQSQGVKLRGSIGDGTNGFVERFRRSSLQEFFRRPFVRRTSRITLTSLQREFDDWLKSYNTGRHHDGFPNYGEAPLTVIQRVLGRSPRQR